MTTASVPATRCVFCEALANGRTEPLLVSVGSTAFVILNKFPYNNGHLMVVPKRHVARLSDLLPDELLELLSLAQVAERVLDRMYRPHGFNLGINLGRSAGAGIADHLHLHVVPRWDGDTSFMTVCGETRVLPEELAVTAERVRAMFLEIHAPAAHGEA